MKKTFAVMLASLLTCSFLVSSSSAVSTSNVVTPDSDDVIVSQPLTFDEMVTHFAQTSGISYEEALSCFPEVPSTRSPSASTYRILTVPLTVTSSYRPKIDFYCHTSENGQYWGIVDIYSVQLNRDYNGTSKHFSGELEFWLRSAYQIEYIINGDFYNNGTTTGGGGLGVAVGLDEVCKVTFNASVANESNHYKYFYDSRIVSFQQ